MFIFNIFFGEEMDFLFPKEFFFTCGIREVHLNHLSLAALVHFCSHQSSSVSDFSHLLSADFCHEE